MVKLQKMEIYGSKVNSPQNFNVKTEADAAMRTIKIINIKL